MPEDTKKNSEKGKGDAKEQRRRRGRQHAAPVEKKIENKPEPPKVTEPEKPAYEPPGPEFYKSLKRETDDILKITEEANTKYKKKEIQSNWAKYEMPIETYEEIDEQENLGADYEALIQAPLSVGGHFQFKHEKSWDLTTGPSVYDKYFDINMENLNLALCTIPFYERNNIEITIFNESDLQSMNHRATKYKQKYYNDKNFTTPELEAQEKILSTLKSEDKHGMDPNITVKDNNEDNNDEKLKQFKDINLEQFEQEPESETSNLITKCSPKNEREVVINKASSEQIALNEDNDVSKVEKRNIIAAEHKEVIDNKITNVINDNDFDEVEKEIIGKNKSNEPKIQIKQLEPNIEQNQGKEVFVQKQEESVIISPKEEEAPKVETIVQKETKKPIIESPEDLEKWLDDFLDG
ncbi:unnamed protein product, partial [Brenthis ino]